MWTKKVGSTLSCEINWSIYFMFRKLSAFAWEQKNALTIGAWSRAHSRILLFNDAYQCSFNWVVPFLWCSVKWLYSSLLYRFTVYLLTRCSHQISYRVAYLVYGSYTDYFKLYIQSSKITLKSVKLIRRFTNVPKCAQWTPLEFQNSSITVVQ